MHTLDISALRKAALTLIVTLAFLFTIDTAVHKFVKIPGYYDWGNRVLQTKAEALEKIVRKHGRVDVLMMGNSIGQVMNVGLWQRASNEELICYNLNIPGYYPDTLEFLLTNYVCREYKPRLVLLSAHPQFLFRGATRQAAEPVEFWESYKVRQLSTHGLWGKSKFFVTTATFFQKAKRHIRSIVQNGTDKVDAGGREALMLDKYGVYHPNNWRNVFGPDKPFTPQGRPFSPWLADYIGKFGATCSENGIDYVLVNQSVIKRSWAAFLPTAFDDYTSALSAHVPANHLVDLPKQLGMDDDNYYDEHHLSIYGQDRVGTYLYDQVVAPRLLQNPAYFSREYVVPLANHLSMSRGFSSAVLPANITGRASFPLLVSTNENGAEIQVAKPLAPGKYEFTLYGTNDYLTTVPLTAPHVITAQLFDEGGAILSQKDVELERRFDLFGGTVRTSFALDCDTTGRLRLVASKLCTGRTLVLDCVGIRRMDLTAPDVAGYVDDTAQFEEPFSSLPIGANLVCNPYFLGLTDFSSKVIATKWSYYGTTGFVNKGVLTIEDPDGGSRAPAVQTVNVQLLPYLVGKTVTLSCVGRSSNPALRPSLTLLGTLEGGEVKSAASKTQDLADGWGVYSTDFTLPNEPLKLLRIDVRILGAAGTSGTIEVKDVRLVIKE